VDEDELLAEQRRFYGARAPGWWRQTGRYDRGAGVRQEWDRQVATVDAALSDFGATGDVLELAGGTGWWTQRLAQTAERLTVVDGSPETLELNRALVARSDIDYVIADLFDWQPLRRFDVVFFSFWLSHVPRSRFAPFWELVRACLRPGGRAFLIDNRADRPDAPHRRDPHVVQYGPDLHLRRLDDGSEWRVVKVTYEPDELKAAITAAGFDAAIEGTPWFIYGSARPTPPPWQGVAR
jgi:SAM-dependent methyltransferase